MTESPSKNQLLKSAVERWLSIKAPKDREVSLVGLSESSNVYDSLGEAYLEKPICATGTRCWRLRTMRSR